MFSTLPSSAEHIMDWTWTDIEPYYQALAARPLDQSNVDEWLSDWSRLTRLVTERYSRHYVATTRDTTSQQEEEQYHRFLESIYPAAEAQEQQLKQKLLDSGLEPAGMEIPLRNMRAEAELYREENLTLFTQERKLATEFNKIIGAQTVAWQGQELTLSQLQPVMQATDRAVRERAWRLASERQLADRDAINDLWGRFLTLRRDIARNAGYEDYRSFRWQQLQRFDYTPADCYRFHDAIEETVVPAARRIYERRRKQLAVERLRPWDLDVDPTGLPALQPVESAAELEATAATIFDRVDPELGDYYQTMRREGLLDLESRKGKGPGAYCASFEAVNRPFIFANAVGVQGDVRTLLHEAGHAFHVFETASLPYYPQLAVPMEFAEVASMAMELLAAPYLTASEGGFYRAPDAARAKIEHLEGIILFWPYMAVVDAFQHWVYENHNAAMKPDECDRVWSELWKRFMGGVDWSGLEADCATGWHRKRHIHRSPFYYVEYGLAQLGAVQVWRGALENQEQAVTRYRQALSLGGTVPLPELYATAGARFAFDTSTLRDAVSLLETRIERARKLAAQA